MAASVSGVETYSFQRQPWPAAWVCQETRRTPFRFASWPWPAGSGLRTSSDWSCAEACGTRCPTRRVETPFWSCRLGLPLWKTDFPSAHFWFILHGKAFCASLSASLVTSAPLRCGGWAFPFHCLYRTQGSGCGGREDPSFCGCLQSSWLRRWPSFLPVTFCTLPSSGSSPGAFVTQVSCLWHLQSWNVLVFLRNLGRQLVGIALQIKDWSLLTWSWLIGRHSVPACLNKQNLN